MIVPFSIWVTNGHSVSTPNLLRITYKGDYNKNEKDVTFLKKGMMTYSCLHGIIMKKLNNIVKIWSVQKKKNNGLQHEEEIEIANMDNISRTQSYQDYYVRNSEIRWAF